MHETQKTKLKNYSMYLTKTLVSGINLSTELMNVGNEEAFYSKISYGLINC